MIFTLDKDQLEKLREWQLKHSLIYTGPIGGRYEYCFFPTSIGTIITVKDCVSKEELDLTGDL